VLAGVLVLGERVTVWTGVGFVLVLAGAYLVTKPRRGAGTPLPAAEGPEAAGAETTTSP